MPAFPLFYLCLVEKYFSLVRKEFLIMVRDAPGMIVLFIMPLLLILVVSLAEESLARFSLKTKTPVLFINESGSAFSKEVEKSIMESGNFTLIGQLNGITLKRQLADSLIRAGIYHAALVITAGNSEIVLLLDPAASEQYGPDRIRSLEYLIKGTEYRLAAQNAVSSLSPAGKDLAETMLKKSVERMTPVEVLYPEKDRASIRPTIMQNNLPGYILFAMFLVVIPIAGNLVGEKGIGYRTRFMTLPVRFSLQLAAKITLYTVVCMGQFLLMFTVGWLIFPGFSGYLDYQPGIQVPLLILSVLTVSLAATGFGIFIGAVSSTHGQTAIFGPLIIVIVAALSGAFLPVYMMPEFLQKISSFSPLFWGLENFVTVFFRQGYEGQVLLHSLYLTLFSFLSVLASVSVLKRKV